jgi:hypothetical protein
LLLACLVADPENNDVTASWLLALLVALFQTTDERNDEVTAIEALPGHGLESSKPEVAVKFSEPA